MIVIITYSSNHCFASLFLQDSFDDLNPQLVVSENEDSGVDSSRRQRFVQRLRQDSVNDFGESTETKESNLKTVCGLYKLNLDNCIFSLILFFGEYKNIAKYGFDRMYKRLIEMGDRNFEREVTKVKSPKDTMRIENNRISSKNKLT